MENEEEKEVKVVVRVQKYRETSTLMRIMKAEKYGHFKNDAVSRPR